MKYNRDKAECKFAVKCKYYHEESFTCNENPGPYCGIWRSFEELKNNEYIDEDDIETLCLTNY